MRGDYPWFDKLFKSNCVREVSRFVAAATGLQKTWPYTMNLPPTVSINRKRKRRPKNQKNYVKPGRGTSCFFEWELLPQHQLEGQDTKFLCDLCKDEIQGSEVKLKLHQIGLHLNPYYLSASDRILAVSEKAANSNSANQAQTATTNTTSSSSLSISNQDLDRKPNSSEKFL